MKISDKMYCKYCGSEIPTDSAFCEKCGKNLKDNFTDDSQSVIGKRCRTCGATVPHGFKTCPNCGVNTFQPIAAELKKCKSCGSDIAANAKQCPRCGKKNHFGVSIFAIIALVFIFVFAIGPISNNSDTAPNPSVVNTQEQLSNNAAENPVDSNTATDTADKILYEDSFFTVSYMKLYDAPEGLNATYLQLKITNKSSQALTLGLEDVYTNDISVYTGTSMPIRLEPGKVSQTPFVLFTANTGLTSADITKVEFKIKGRDDAFKEVHTTDKITIGK